MVLMKDCVEICLLYKWCTKLFEVVLNELKHYITASTCSYRSFTCEDSLSQTLSHSAFFTAYMTFELVMYVAKKMGEEASEGGGSGGMSVPLLKPHHSSHQ